jgi:hypothetical protein
MPSRLLLALLVFAGPQVIEEILAVVDGRPVLLSEVSLLARVRGLDQNAALEALIDERLMFQEASRLPETALTPEDEEKAYLSLKPQVKATDIGESALRALARRQSIILKYIDFRFRAQVRVSDDEVQKAYGAEFSGKAGAPPFESVREALRARLTSDALDQKIEAWVKELRSAADIRYNTPPEPSPSPGVRP